MNCFDYRRVLLAEARETEAMAAHRSQCAVCGALFSEHAAFERELRRGLEVPIPPGFGERLIGAAGVRARAAPGRADRRRFLAAAAAAIAAAGVGLYVWRDRNDPLAMACIEFVMKEEAKSIMMGAMPRAEAARVLAESLPLERLEQIGQIKHIGPCPFNGATAYHVVVAVPQDKVTLLIMPDARVAARRRALHDGLHASVIPLRKGSVGIIAANPAVVDSIAGALRG